VQQLIQPEALAARLETQRDDATLLLVHVAAPAAYSAGHIRGAVHVTPSELVAGTRPAPGRLPEREQLTTLFERIGYRPDLEIVAYDDEGGGWAGRFLWTLDVIGHANWRYLDGGVHAWIGAGLPLDTDPVDRTPSDVRLEISPVPSASVDEILERLGDPELLIWDCRSAAEFRGEKSGSSRAGHIPGAVNLDWLDLMDRDRGLRLRSDLAALLAAHGIDRQRDIVTHCQTHHRSGLSYLVGRLLGFPRIRAYPGSWSEWGNRQDTPVVTGP